MDLNGMTRLYQQDCGLNLFIASAPAYAVHAIAQAPDGPGKSSFVLQGFTHCTDRRLVDRALESALNIKKAVLFQSSHFQLIQNRKYSCVH
jgi:hypothetical protein